MSETMLELRGVSKNFGHKPVLKEVDLSLSAGSVLGLVGKNGAGKTTLLKCALGLQRPQLGDVRILGEPAWELSAAGKERLGYVPQEINLVTVQHLLGKKMRSCGWLQFVVWRDGRIGVPWL